MGSKSNPSLGYCANRNRPYCSELKKGSAYAAIDITRSVAGVGVYEARVVTEVARLLEGRIETAVDLGK